MDIEQPMMHIRLYGEGGRYEKSTDIKKRKKRRNRRKRKNTYTIADEQPSTLGLPDLKKGLGYRSP
jgi:hypothetical protein